jgi:glycine dehydrogenase
VASFTAILSAGLQQLGLKVVTPYAFDTLTVECEADAVLARALAGGANLRRLSPTHVGVALDETSTRADVEALWSWFSPGSALAVSAFEAGVESLIPAHLRRSSAFLTHPVFNTHHSETEMLRYIRSLSDKDLALDRSMIPLGSCTMKLNATTEMIPITWPEFAGVHPFAPQTSWPATPSSTRNCAAGCARPPATPASACSPMPGPRASTPVCWPFAPGTPAAASRSATSA